LKKGQHELKLKPLMMKVANCCCKKSPEDFEKYKHRKNESMLGAPKLVSQDSYGDKYT